MADAAGIPEEVEVSIVESRPRLLATAAETAGLRARLSSDPWAAEVAGILFAEADALVAAPLDIPHAEGQWSHWYVGEGGNRLVPRSPTEHVDPKTGQVYTGAPYDAVYVAMRHGYWLRGVQKLGMAYALTGEVHYAERARNILLEYASFYAGLMKHTKGGDFSLSGARLFAQTLDEAVLACYLVTGYDLVYDAPCFTATDHAVIAKDLLRPMVRVIRANDKDTSNWQSWHNAAVGLIGFLLDDSRLVDVAINGRHGLLYQLRRSTYGSGLWYELAPIYHWYALNACTYLFEAAARNGMDLFGIDRVRGMFAAPIRLVLPDGTFAPMHDSDRLRLRDDRWFMEVAYARYGDPRFAAAAGPRPRGGEITHKSEDLPESRALGLEAALLTLFWGAQDWPEKVPLVQHSSNEPSEGLAVLRASAGHAGNLQGMQLPEHPEENSLLADLTVLFDYGPGLAGHVQPAKLGIVLFAHGDIRLVDPGRATYAHPLQKGWYRRTIAHNTVVVDAQDQVPAKGRLRAWARHDGWALVRAYADDAYPGVTLDRTLLLVGDLLVDVFLCWSEERHTYDLPMHLRGELRGLPEIGTPAVLSEEPGYKSLWDTAPLVAPLNECTLETGTGEIVLRALDESESWYALGHGPLAREEPVPMVLRRQRGEHARFVTVLGPEEAVRRVKAAGGDLVLIGERSRLRLTPTATVLTLYDQTWRINQAGAVAESPPSSRPVE